MENTPNTKNWYDKSYKIMLAVPVAFLVLCLVYLGMFYSQHGDFIYKDPSLSGGTTITLNGEISSGDIRTSLEKDFKDVSVREIKDIATGKLIAVVIDSSAEPTALQAGVEKALGQKLTEANSNIEFTGPSLSQGFYKQLLIAIAISFLLMSIVIFFLFKTAIPSLAVIFAAFGDIVMALAAVNFLGIRLSAAGIAAFLMLIGYSVDTDILLTTRVLKKVEGSVNQRIFGAFKTGIFMTSTALAAVLPAFFVITGLPDSFRQIFLVLSLGLGADIINTWLTNAGIIKWYADAKGIK